MDVIIVMGSDSDLPIVKSAAIILSDFGIDFKMRVISAHRTPEDLVAMLSEAESAGVKLFIAAAGGAAHLAGVVASHTTRPVFGVPIDASPLNGMDALLATVQMPQGVPVATFGIGKSGAANAALCAVRMLALNDRRIAQALADFVQQQKEKVRAKDRKLQSEGWA